MLSGNFEGAVLDNRYYAGSCLPHYIQHTRFRKPYNLQHYTVQVSEWYAVAATIRHGPGRQADLSSPSFQTKGVYDFTLDVYDSYSRFEERSMEARMSKTSVSFGINVPGVMELGFNYRDEKYKNYVSIKRSYSGRVSPLLMHHTYTESL